MPHWNESDLTPKQLARIPQDATHGLGEAAKPLWVQNPNISPDMREEPDYTKPSQPSLRKEVQKLLTARNWHWYHTRDSRGSRKGFPDIWAAREADNRVIYIELKRTDRKMTQQQQEVFDMLKRMGREVHLIRPADWEHLVEVVW